MFDPSGALGDGGSFMPNVDEILAEIYDGRNVSVFFVIGGDDSMKPAATAADFCEQSAEPYLGAGDMERGIVLAWNGAPKLARLDDCGWIRFDALDYESYEDQEMVKLYPDAFLRDTIISLSKSEKRPGDFFEALAAALRERAEEFYGGGSNAGAKLDPPAWAIGRWVRSDGNQRETIEFTENNVILSSGNLDMRHQMENNGLEVVEAAKGDAYRLDYETRGAKFSYSFEKQGGETMKCAISMGGFEQVFGYEKE
jgi:hypothetical protein